MHIGLIGGIGPAATDFYYRRLIAAFAQRQAELTLTIVHADTPTLLGNLSRDDRAAQVSIYKTLSDRLVRADADCVVVTSIAGHFCIEDFKPVSPLPVIDILEEVRLAVAARGLERIGILGTKTVMQTRFYGGLGSVAVVPPIGDDLAAVHNAYVTMAAAGAVDEGQRRVFDSASQRLIAQEGAEAILLGGTDLALVYDPETARFPLVDCAAIHVDAIVRRVLS